MTTEDFLIDYKGGDELPDFLKKFETMREAFDAAVALKSRGAFLLAEMISLSPLWHTERMEALLISAMCKIAATTAGHIGGDFGHLLVQYTLERVTNTMLHRSDDSCRIFAAAAVRVYADGDMIAHLAEDHPRNITGFLRMNIECRCYGCHEAHRETHTHAVKKEFVEIIAELGNPF